jgi:hypothetical protein
MGVRNGLQFIGGLKARLDRVCCVEVPKPNARRNTKCRTE